MFYKKKQWRPPSKKEKRRKQPHMPKPEEHEGMPQHKHCPIVKHREDKSSK
jgi:hypothetical protein